MHSSESEKSALPLLSKAPWLAWDPAKIGLVLVVVILMHFLDWLLGRLWFVHHETIQSALNVTPLLRGGELGTFSGARFGWNPISSDVLELVVPQGSLGNVIYLLLRLAIKLVVWGGVFILLARSAVEQLEGGKERSSLITATTGSLTRSLQTVIGPALLVAGILGLLILNVVFGIFCAIPLLGKPIGGALLVIPLCGGVIVAVLMLVLILGWPVMMAMAGVERHDGIELMKRTSNYFTSHPVLFVGYALLVSFVLGLISHLLGLFAGIVRSAVVTPLSWGVGQKAGTALVDPWQGNRAAEFWLSLPFRTVEAYLIVLFATAMTLVYLLLRRKIEGTPVPGETGVHDAVPTGRAL